MAEASDQEIRQVLTQWRLTRGAPLAWKALHDKHTVFLVESELEPAVILKLAEGVSVTDRIESEHGVLCHLGRSGVPVSVPILADTGKPYALMQDRVYTLSPILPSDDREALPSPAAADNIGNALSRLHRALAAYPKPIRSWHYDLPSRVFDEAVPYIREHLSAPHAADLDSMARLLRPGMTRALTGLPEQHIHGDSHGGNILLHGGQVSGFIDLDHLPSGPRIYDLGYWMADLMKNRLYQPEALTHCFRLFGALIGGYDSETHLSEREREALWPAMLAVQLMFTQTFFSLGNGDQAHRNLTAFYSMCWQKEQITRGILGAGGEP